GAHGRELWKSDGTEAGTVLVKDINAGSFDAFGNVFTFAVVDWTLFFRANDGIHGVELWRSDGTEAGTVLVKDINPGRSSGDPVWLTAVEGTLLFQANDGSHGSELWRSDGVEEGTVQVQDIVPGAQGSSPGAFTVVGNRVFFSANDGVHGLEPWIGRAAILTDRPQRAIQDLRDEVTALGLPTGIERSLTAKLDVASEALAWPDRGRIAIRALENFTKEVKAQSPRRISEKSAGSLLDFAQDIVSLLEGAFAISEGGGPGGTP
ncbi:MAG: hypothetical protein L0191_13225, partial [Acidobacteria bacterium]|nr:hypothetical protein [Acidobacteriota bacterium]